MKTDSSIFVVFTGFIMGVLAGMIMFSYSTPAVYDQEKLEKFYMACLEHAHESAYHCRVTAEKLSRISAE